MPAEQAKQNELDDTAACVMAEIATEAAEVNAKPREQADDPDNPEQQSFRHGVFSLVEQVAAEWMVPLVMG